MAKIKREDIDRFFDYGVYLPSRCLYMGAVKDEPENSGTDHRMTEIVVKSLHILDMSEGPIKIVMNNVGGDEYEGFAIYDAIRACKNHVEIQVFGHAMSMGAFILQAADKRVLSPNSRVMIHYGTWSFDGHAKDAKKWADEAEFLNKRMEEVLFVKIREKHKKYTMEKLRGMLQFDTFLSAKQSVEIGLADEILNTDGVPG